LDLDYIETCLFQMLYTKNIQQKKFNLKTN
jgi:hypothetical protein